VILSVVCCKLCMQRSVEGRPTNHGTGAGADAVLGDPTTPMLFLAYFLRQPYPPCQFGKTLCLRQGVPVPPPLPVVVLANNFANRHPRCSQSHHITPPVPWFVGRPKGVRYVSETAS
jgi:hypothetical protein